jgi:hypothetical protein
MESNESEMAEIRDDHEKMKHDVKALKKMYLDNKKGSSSTSSNTVSTGLDQEAITAIKRSNASQIQRAQDRFDRQLKELRSDLSSKHATHDRVLAKIEESVNRAMALSLKSATGNSVNHTIKSGLKPPTKPKGPPPPNAKRAPGSNNNGSLPLTSTMSASAALQQAAVNLEESKEKAELKFEDDVRRTRAMLERQKKVGKSNKKNITNNTTKTDADVTSTAPSVASSLLAPPSTNKEVEQQKVKQKMQERQQCPFCLKRFEPDVLVNHKINCDCRTVHCQYCNKGRMARQLKTHEQFCDQNPINAAKSEKKKCQHCDKYFTPPQLAAHQCDWEPKQCKICNMQIIARDIGRHEEKCAAKLTKKRSSNDDDENNEDNSVEAEEPRCCSFGDCDCSRFVPSTSSRVRPSHPHLICATCGHGALYHQSPDASKALALRSSSEGIQWAKDFQANSIADSPVKSAGTKTSAKSTSSIGQKLTSVSAEKKKKVKEPSALMQVAAGMTDNDGDGRSSFDSGEDEMNINSKAKRGTSEKKKRKRKNTKKSSLGGGLDSAVSGVSSEKSSLLSYVESTQGSYSTTSRKSHEEVHPSAWTVDQVCDWLASHGIPEKIREKFSEQVIDGFMLLNTEEDDVVHDLQITRRAEVNKLLAAIQLLKSKAKRSSGGDEENSDDDSSDFEHSEEDNDVSSPISRW